MDPLCVVSRKLSNSAIVKLKQLEGILTGDVLCSISNQNVVAFLTTTTINDCNGSSWGSHVYVADLNTPWITHKVTSNQCVVTVLEWNLSGENLLIADSSGCVQIWGKKEHILNDWVCIGTASFPGEHILSGVFFHNGKKISLLVEKKDSFVLNEKFGHLRVAPSVKGFGGRPLEGCLVVSATGMVGVIVLNKEMQVGTMVSSSESLAAMRNRITTADICYGKNGDFLVAVSSGSIKQPIQCYRVSVKRVDDKCQITSQALPSFFLQNMQSKDQTYKRVIGLKFVVREDTDSLVVAANGDNGGVLELWELREKTVTVHRLFQSKLPAAATDAAKTVVWQHQSSHKASSPIISITTSKLSITSTVPPPSYVILALTDGTINCLFREGLKLVSSANVNAANRNDDGLVLKSQRLDIKLSKMDMSWLGNVLLCTDVQGHFYLYRLMPITEQGGPMTVPYACTLLEYCLVTGLDWWDLLVCLRANMLEAVVEKFTENYNRQNAACKQFYYAQFLCIKTSLYRMSAAGQTKAADLTSLLMLSSIANAFKSLLRPSDMTNHEKGPAESLAAVVTDSLTDVDKVLIHLEAKDYTVEHSTLQSLQQLIQWVADLAVNILAKLPEQRCTGRASGYQLTRDYQALNTLRELLVIIRIWGLLRQSCLPVFIRSVENLDVLAHLFKLLSRLIQNPEPDDNLLDDCCLLPNQVMISHVHDGHPVTHLASPALFHLNLPLQMEFGIEPETLTFKPDVGHNDVVFQVTEIMDSFRHVYMGRVPLVVKQCCRCGAKAQATSASRRTAAIVAWDQRWVRACRCSGFWRIVKHSIPGCQSG